MDFYYVPWDVRYNRPVVNNQVTNPTTGAIEAAGSEGLTAGPPCIDAIWVNLNRGSPAFWKVHRSYLFTTLDKALAQITEHLQQEVYSITSLNATAYSVTVVCESTKTDAEMSQALFQLKSNLTSNQQPAPPLEGQAEHGNEDKGAEGGS